MLTEAAAAARVLIDDDDNHYHDHATRHVCLCLFWRCRATNYRCRIRAQCTQTRQTTSEIKANPK